MYIFHLNSIFESTPIDKSSILPENSCIIPENDPLVNVSLYLGGNVTVYSGIAVVAFKSSELLERFYDFSSKYCAIFCQTSDNLFFPGFTFNPVFYNANLNKSDIRYIDTIATNNPFDRLEKLGDKFQKLLGLAIRISRDREVKYTSQLCRSLSEDIDLFADILRQCELFVDLGEQVFGEQGIVKLPDRTISTLLFCYPEKCIECSNEHKEAINKTRLRVMRFLENSKSPKLKEIYSKVYKYRNSITHELFPKSEGLQDYQVWGLFIYLSELVAICLDLYLFKYEEIRLLDILLDCIPKSDMKLRRSLIPGNHILLSLYSSDKLQDLLDIVSK